MKSSRSIASASSPALAVIAALVALVALAWPGVAHARKRLVVLEFTGPKAEEFQADLEKILKKRHSLVPQAKWDAAADDLGATKLTDANVKRIAGKLNVDGVIVGKSEKRGSRYYLHLKLRAGASGKVLAEPEVIERSGGLGPDGRDTIDESLLPVIDELPKLGGGDDDEDADADDDADDRGSRGKGKGKPTGKGKGKLADDDDDDDDRPGWGRGRDDDDEDADDEDDDRGSRGKGKATGKGKPTGKGKGKPADDDDDDGDDDDDDDRGAGRGDDRDDDDGDDRGDDGDDRDDDGDDDDRVASRDDDDDRDDRDDRDDDDGDRDDRGGPADPRPAMDLSAGLSFTGRKLGFTTNLVQNAPQGYSGAPVPGLRITGDLYPLAFNKRNRSFTRNLGVTGLFDRAIKISSELKTATMTYTLPTVEQHLAFGVIYRHPVSPTLTIEGSVRYNKRKFVINKSSAPADAVDIPNTDYSYVDPGVGVHYVLGPKAALSADARFLLITDTGEMQSPDQYGASTVTGVDLGLAVDYRVAQKIVVRAALGLATIGYAFKGNGALTNNRDGQPASVDVSGARDTYYGGSAGAAYLF
jgi:hypothetical protein